MATKTKRDKNSYLSPKRKSKNDMQYYYKPFSKRKKEDKKAKRQVVFLILIGLAIIAAGFYFSIPIINSITSIWQKDTVTTSPGDTTPPSPPQINASNLYSNTNQISVSGTAEPGTTIDLYNVSDDSHIANTITGADRVFTFDAIYLDAGENDMYAIASDSANNQSAKSQIVTITYLSKAPPLTITGPSDNELVTNNTQSVAVSGYTNPDTLVTINGFQAILDNTNAFNYTLRGLSEGENIIKIIATDKAGNSTEAYRTITYQNEESNN